MIIFRKTGGKFLCLSEFKFSKQILLIMGKIDCIQSFTINLIVI